MPNPGAASYDRHRMIRLAHADGDGRNRIIGEAYEAWDRLWADLGRSHYAETGVLMTARNATDWAVSCRAAFDRNGTPYQVWDRAELGRRCPYLALGEYDWGLFTQRGGALFADRIVDDLVGLLRERGVTIRPHAAVAEVDPERGLVTLAGGEQADRGCRHRRRRRLDRQAAAGAGAGADDQARDRRSISSRRPTSPPAGRTHPACSTSPARAISICCRRWMGCR